MTFGDGLLHRAVASHLAADGSSVPPIVAHSGPALRYGRIGFPVVLWILSAGREGAMPYVQPIIMVLCAAGIAMTTVALLPAPSVIFAMVPFVAIGLTLSLAGGFAEPLGVLLALLAVLLVERDRRWAAAAALAGAMFARENAAVVVVGLVAWIALRHRLRDAAAVSLSFLPVAAWHVIVDQRFGYLPLRDSWLVETHAFGVPIVAVGRALREVPASAIVIIAVHLLVGAAALVLWKSSALGMVAAASAIPILSEGELSWRHIGDAARLAVFLEVFVILAVCRVHLMQPRGEGRQVAEVLLPDEASRQGTR